MLDTLIYGNKKIYTKKLSTDVDKSFFICG